MSKRHETIGHETQEITVFIFWIIPVNDEKDIKNILKKHKVKRFLKELMFNCYIFLKHVKIRLKRRKKLKELSNKELKEIL